jgi:uncharacterized protein YgiB involved in biofilm formation
MKRSHAIILGIAGMAIVASVISDKNASDEPTEALVYASAEECKAEGKIAASECDSQLATAAEKQLIAAPKFESQQDCETAHGTGKCRSATMNGTSVFLPAMVGYLIGRQLSGGGASATQPLYPANPATAGCGTGSTTSCTRTGSGGLVMRTGGSSASGANAFAPRSAVKSVASNTSVISRGGFGSTAYGMGAGS